MGELLDAKQSKEVRKNVVTFIGNLLAEADNPDLG
jgi:hypothetical protein